MVPPASHRVSRVPWYSGSYLKSSRLKYWAVTICGGAFQLSSSTIPLRYDMSTTPPNRSRMVWALSLSLAATDEIDFSFFSSGYLDVSVPRVPLVKLCIHLTILRHYSK